MKETLFERLKLKEPCSLDEVNAAYEDSKKTKKDRYAWKVLKDQYYRKVYEKYHSEEILMEAGFFEDTLDNCCYYQTNFLTTPIHKLIEYENPIVLLSTGGFNPIHDGHIHMMELAKKALENNGYKVAGGFLSPCHDDYASAKPYNHLSAEERVHRGQICLQNHPWLMIDPFEALYCKSTINFTDVITRLEQYLKRNYNHNTKVAYVYGADNAGFSYCFEEIGIGICIDRYGFREKFEQAKKQHKNNKNILFIDNDSNYAMCKSRDIRKYQHNNIKEEAQKDFLIRDEGIYPLKNLSVKYNEKNIIKAQKRFTDNLVKLFKSFLECCVKTIELEKQLEYARENLINKNTISLDCYYHGTYDLRISRLFPISDIQSKYIKMIGKDKEPINEIIKNIKPGKYVLVDDDSVSGNTIKNILDVMPENIKIEKIFLLSSMIEDDFFDIVDCRDFIVGADNAGLMVHTNFAGDIRVPYTAPYVNLKTRASIPINKVNIFSAKVWMLNKEFYQEIGNVKLKDLNKDFIKLMTQVGFSKETNITEICDWHINRLTQN